MKTETQKPHSTEELQASFSMLIMSIASNSLMAMGHTPDPTTGKTEVDKQLAKFNIELLITLKEKTKNNLSGDEQGLLDHIIHDLQLKFVQLK
jgi:hypothetical protein